MRIVRRSRRLSAYTPLDSLDQCVPGGFDCLDIGSPEPLIERPVATAHPDNPFSLLSPEAIEALSTFADGRELPPHDFVSEPRPRKGKNGPTRSANAFLVFRSDFWKYNKELTGERNHRQISRMAGACWRVLPESRKLPYQIQAKKLQEEHLRMLLEQKHNSPAKGGVRKKVKQEFDDDELCDVLAAQVAQDIRASRLQRTHGSEESGLLDKVMERKANLKRCRSTAVERAPKVESGHFKPPAKKRKKGPPKPAINTVPVSGMQAQAGSPHPPFVPTSQIPVLALPPSHDSPVVKGEPLPDQIVELLASLIPTKMEAALSLPPAEPSKEEEEVPKLELPEMPALPSPQFPSISYEPPVQYLPGESDEVLDKGWQFFAEYGMARLIESSYLGDFDDLGDASVSMGGFGGDDGFAQWCGTYTNP